jgi:RNA polymerase sigma-70 factor, ECF subfamily
MAEPDDPALIRRVIDGDEESFRLLFRRHSPAMYGVAFRLLARRGEDAEDAVQEAWLRGVRKLRSFRGDSSLNTWLVGITIRCALEISRRRQAGDQITDRPASGGFAPEVVDLERAIAALAAGYRHVLLLHDVHGYTHAEIASLLGIEEGTSKSQLSRARSLVRHALAGSPEELRK